MNDKMCSLGLAEVLAVIAYEKVNKNVAEYLESNLKKGFYRRGVSNMLETSRERNVFNFIENNVLYNEVNNGNILIFQENIFVDSNQASNSQPMNKDIEYRNLKSISYEEKNRMAVFQKTVSDVLLKYMSKTEYRLKCLPILVYLGRSDEYLDINCMLSRVNSNIDYTNNPYSQYGLEPNKDFLFLDVKSINWGEILKLNLETIDKNEKVYRAKKLIVAGYYKILQALYDGKEDQIFYPLHKIQLAIKCINSYNHEELYSYLMGICESLTDKLSFFEAAHIIRNRFEIEQYFNEFLTIN